MNNANPGWYFYRAYYRDFFDGNKDYWLTKDEAKTKFKGGQLDEFEKQQRKSFKKLNEELFTCASNAVSTHISGNLGIGVDSIDLSTTYPGLLIGTGYDHETGTTGEFKLGFFFDHTTGLPVIPGTSVKGVIRSVFPGFTYNEARGGFNIDQLYKNDDDRFAFNKKIECAGFAYWLVYGSEKSGSLNANDYMELFILEQLLFESVTLKSLKDHLQDEEKPLQYCDIYHRDVFYDAYISSSRNEGNSVLGSDFITPHLHPEFPAYDIYTEPVPLQMLKILPNVIITFQFKLKNPEAVALNFDNRARLTLYERILSTIGAGAKTNTGYGQFISKDHLNDETENKEPVESKEEYYVSDLQKLRVGDSIRATIKYIIGRKIGFILTDFENIRCDEITYGSADKFSVGDKVSLKVASIGGKFPNIKSISVKTLVEKI